MALPHALVPPEVIAITTPTDVQLAWEPAEGATTYGVWGLQNHQPVLLDQVTGLVATAPLGYDAYGVSVIVDGVSGEIRYAKPKCVEINDDFPYVVIRDCGYVAQTRILIR